MVVRRFRELAGSLLAASAIVLASCGGSNDSSTQSTSTDSVAVDAGAPADAGADQAAFCAAALDNQGGADIADDDDPSKIAQKLSKNADTLATLAAKAPAAVKTDAEAVADAARSMADAISADPTLEKFNTLIAEFATSDANDASQKVQTWVKDNCEAGKS